MEMTTCKLYSVYEYLYSYFPNFMTPCMSCTSEGLFETHVGLLRRRSSPHSRSATCVVPQKRTENIFNFDTVIVFARRVQTSRSSHASLSCDAKKFHSCDRKKVSDAETAEGPNKRAYNVIGRGHCPTDTKGRLGYTFDGNSRHPKLGEKRVEITLLGLEEFIYSLDLDPSFVIITLNL